MNKIRFKINRYKRKFSKFKTLQANQYKEFNNKFNMKIIHFKSKTIQNSKAIRRINFKNWINKMK